MILKNNIILLISFFLLEPFTPLNAQNISKQSNDTLETFFINQHQKDGYEVNGRILNIPDYIVSKCDNRKIRVIGKPSYYKAICDSKNEDADSTIVRQGRYEYSPVENDTGGIMIKRHFVSTGSDFSIVSISIWNKEKKRWKKIYVSDKSDN